MLPWGTGDVGRLSAEAPEAKEGRGWGQRKPQELGVSQSLPARTRHLEEAIHPPPASFSPWGFQPPPGWVSLTTPALCCLLPEGSWPHPHGPRPVPPPQQTDSKFWDCSSHNHSRPLNCTWIHRISISHSVSCDTTDCSSPGSSVHGILQARILEWVAIPFSRGSSRPRGWTQVSRIAGGFCTV